MSKRAARSQVVTVADFCAAMEKIAPIHRAQEWDNVGLLAGDPVARIRRAVLCVDLTPSVVDEVLRQKADLVMAYHPPIFKPVSALRATSPGTDAAVFRCIQGGAAIYSTHTALDAAAGGTDEVLAGLCGAVEIAPLEYARDSVGDEFKMVVFVPKEEVEHIAQALFDAGAGRIGNYTQCGFRLAGTGSFFGGEGTDPTVGHRGRLEFVDEIRLETVVPKAGVAAVVAALRRAHSYEEPAFDIYPLEAKLTAGTGRIGRLPRSSALGKLAAKLKRATQSRCVQIIGTPQRLVERVIVMVGAAGSIPMRHGLLEHDAIVTGEIRHHDALAIQRLGACAIALGHWSSERPGLAALRDRLAARVPSVAFLLSAADQEPFCNV